MIENREILDYIENYFDSIKHNLPANSKFTKAYKYNLSNSSTDDLPLSANDKIVVYYSVSDKDKWGSSFSISNSTIITYLRNKKLDQLGI